MNTLLTEILAAREARAARQQALLRQYGSCVVCFTMNIAGPVKTSPLIRRAFEAGMEALRTVIPAESVLHLDELHSVTGDEAILCVDLPAEALKARCVALEESAPIGRLFDMDVLDPEGRKLERSRQRGCLVCGKPGRSCAATRAHSVAQLQKATADLIHGYFDRTDALRIGQTAVHALIAEVRTTPKPGLVDLLTSGSHQDMDVPLFTRSALELGPYFHRCALIGQQTADLPPRDVFPLLREAGLAAEETMYRVTGGVNTHKGAIYILGILCAAAARLLHCSGESCSEADILSLCAQISGDAAREALEKAPADTAGLRLYRQLGITGIRGEMAEGLPSVRCSGLPVFRKALAEGFSRNDAGVLTLLHLIARVQDTNLYRRGGEEGAAFAADTAKDLLSGPRDNLINGAKALDRAFTARNLSPGGCADLLAATYFLDCMLDPEGP